MQWLQFQLSIPNFSFKKQNFIFGELFHLIFMILHDNWLKNIGKEIFLI